MINDKPDVLDEDENDADRTLVYAPIKPVAQPTPPPAEGKRSPRQVEAHPDEEPGEGAPEAGPS